MDTSYIGKIFDVMIEILWSIYFFMNPANQMCMLENSLQVENEISGSMATQHIIDLALHSTLHDDVKKRLAKYRPCSWTISNAMSLNKLINSFDG